MTLMRALARITEGMKGTQLSLAIVLHTSPKPSTISIGNVYLIYFMAYEISPSSVELEKAYQTVMCNIEDWIDGCHTRNLSDDWTIRPIPSYMVSIVHSAKSESTLWDEWVVAMPRY